MFPWWLKIPAKLILSRIPFSYRIFAWLGIFRHGHMDDADYAYSTFKKHFSLKNGEGSWVGAEIGPGDSVFSAILAQDQGATAYWLADAGDFANHSLDRYAKMVTSLEQRGLLKSSFRLAVAGDFNNLLKLCNAHYLTNGVDSLSEIPDESVDFVWSNAVLEHIRAARFPDFCDHMYRILRPSGCSSHQVDFKDHLATGLNNLRFPTYLWEREWFAPRSGFYTNRIRSSQMVKAFEEAGFEVKIVSQTKWEAPPISRSQLAQEFTNLNDSDLLLSGTHLLLTKPSKRL